MIKIAAVILNFNGARVITECLVSLRKSRLPKNSKLQILVVDNASSDHSLVLIKGIIKDFRDAREFFIIENKQNLGFAGGNNAGMRFALERGADFVITLNQDTAVHEDFLVELFEVISGKNSIGAVSPKIYFAKGYEYHKTRYQENELGKVIWYAGGHMDWKNIVASHRGVDEVDQGLYDTAEETDFATGCCMMLKSEALRKVGMFDERYFLYYEDNDLSQRMRRNGYRIFYAPNSVVWHINASASGGSGSALQDYYISRNRMLFGFRYARWRSKIAIFRESIAYLLHGRTWQKRGIRDFYLHRLNKGSYPQLIA